MISSVTNSLAALAELPAASGEAPGARASRGAGTPLRLGASHGLSSATVTRLTEQWRDDAKRFGQRSLRKLPRQGHTAELDSAGAVGRGRKRVGGTSPSASCGRSSL